jgi:hypothetical protein
MTAKLSRNAARLLRQHVRTPLELEVLLVLSGAPDRWWTAIGTAAVLRISAASVAPVLETLLVGNLLDIKMGADLLYRFAPIDPAAERAVREIARLHPVERQAALAASTRGGAAGAARPWPWRRIRDGSG